MLTRLNDWFVAAGGWAVLLPVWRRSIRARNGRVAAVIATGIIWLVIIAAVAGPLGGGDDSADNGGRAAAQGSPGAKPERTIRPTNPPTTSPSPGSVASATPAPTIAVTGTPIAGAAAAPGITPPADLTPAPAPPAAGAALVIVSSSSYTDSDGGYHVAGEVRNTTADYMDYVEISGTFFDAGGQVVASEYTFTHVDLIAPSDTAGFDLVLTNGAALGVSRYELAVRGELSADRPAPGLVVTAESPGVDGNDFHVVGTVANQSGASAEFVTVAGTFYGADGTVVRSDFTYVDADVVQPGESVSFDLVVPEAASAGIAHYQLRVEGFPA
jgi:hypothetical protein